MDGLVKLGARLSSGSGVWAEGGVRAGAEELAGQVASEGGAAPEGAETDAALRATGEALQAATAGFLDTDADARWWAGASPQDQEDDGLSPCPRPACEVISDRFAAALHAAGIAATVVEGTDADYGPDPLTGSHRWVVVGESQVDWTVRQFHSLAGPAGPASRDCRVPLVWPAGRPHPILRFRHVAAVR